MRCCMISVAGSELQHTHASAHREHKCTGARTHARGIPGTRTTVNPAAFDRANARKAAGSAGRSCNTRAKSGRSTGSSVLWSHFRPWSRTGRCWIAPRRSRRCCRLWSDWCRHCHRLTTCAAGDTAVSSSVSGRVAPWAVDLLLTGRYGATDANCRRVSGLYS